MNYFNKKVIFLSTFIFLNFVWYNALTQTTSSNIVCALEEAESLYKEKEFEKSIEQYSFCEEYFRQVEDWDNWFKAVSRIRLCRQKTNEFSRALEEVHYFSQFIPNEEKNILGKLRFITAVLFIKKLDFYNSIKSYKEALFLFNGDEEAKVFVRACYNNISLNYSRIGDQKSALTFVNAGIDYCTKNGMHEYLCSLNKNKGQYYFYDGQYDEALKQYKRSFDFCENNGDCSYLHIAIAEVLLRIGQISQAKEHLDLAKLLNKGIGQYYSIIYNRYLFENGDVEAALEKLPRTFELIERNNDTRNLIKEMVKFSQFLLENNESELALEYAHKSLSYYFKDLDADNFYQRPKFDESIPYSYVIEALKIKASYFKEKYLSTKEESYLEEAFFYYENLLNFFDLHKHNFYSTASKYRLGEIIQEHYAEAISFFVGLYQEEGSQVHFERAFNMAQKANAFVLRNAISDRKALQLAKVSQDSIDQYLEFVWKTGEDGVQDSISKVNTLIEFDNYRSSILENYTSYAKYDQKEEITLDEIQSELKENSLLLKYYYYDNTLSIFGITKGHYFAENIRIENDFLNLINEYVELVGNEATNESLKDQYLLLSSRIYDKIIGGILNKGVLQHIDHLIIVPDGPLKKISFSTLVKNRLENWHDPNTFLIGSYSLNYLYYCSQLRDDGVESTSNEFIGFGIEYQDEFLEEITKDYLSNFKEPESSTRALALGPLEYADDEAVDLAALFGGKSFVNSDVTRNKVIEAINEYEIVHISAHAFVDEDDYLNSYVVLNKNEQDEFRLGYTDILNLDLKNELVVLSACQTSNGKNVTGEGLMSLSRAFVQSGSRSAVGAYWNAPDYATKELMTQFYLNLDKGYSKSKAMQQAQIEFLTNDNISSPTIRSPFFWGSWAVYGNDKTIEFSKSFVSPTVLMVIVLGILLFIIAAFMIKVLRVNK